MPFSVALNQPRFAPDDDGGLSGWSDILTSITDIAGSAAKVGVAYVQAQAPQPTQQTQAQAAALYALQNPANQGIWQGQTASITSSPMFLPLVGGLGLLLVAMVMKGKR